MECVSRCTSNQWHVRCCEHQTSSPDQRCKSRQELHAWLQDRKGCILWWPFAAVLQMASPKGQPTSPGAFGRLDQEVCRLLGEIMRDSRGRIRYAYLGCLTGCTSPVLTAKDLANDSCHGLPMGHRTRKLLLTELFLRLLNAQGGRCSCRKEHFSQQTLDKLAELPPERGKLILKNLQRRNWRDVSDVSQAVWVAMKHFK